ncbi:formylglycine-generating enzyme family protein [Roseateles sp. SL47]|uniref:formylglycine-generating enzyme family protein n=1 Tax=Roseateles sp. SL47 TaxID=2995138 RepID=UPI00226EBC01|nr:formylglycine-generating enzyme family protein [Roseateles sp. SL47]WAC71974.1 formylglycine-generating enzyme family protein [Roseateles sp. SL47]
MTRFAAHGLAHAERLRVARWTLYGALTGSVLLGCTSVGDPAAQQTGRRDCPVCPDLVVIAAGTFRMGSDASDPRRAKDGREEPAHEAQVSRSFALARREVTVEEFERFITATGYVTDAERAPAQGCLAWLPTDHALGPRPALSWRSPGYAQTPQHPVVCVSWNDARAYTQWLGSVAGQLYRLPTETEWEYAARAGSHTHWPWGNDDDAGEEAPQGSPACRFANVADTTEASDGFHWSEHHYCSDGHFQAAPVGRLEPNRFGVQDMIGNVWEWVQDCYAPEAYADGSMPRDGSPRETAHCPARGLRGGAWISGPARTRPAYRGGYAPQTRSNVFGFRVARDL